MKRVRLSLRSIIIGAVSATALTGALSLLVLLTLSASRHASFEGAVVAALEDESVAHGIRAAVERQLDVARAYAADSNPVLPLQFEAAGRTVHRELRFYLFRRLSEPERRLVEHIRETHARIEVAAQRVFIGAPHRFDAELEAALGRDLDRFLAYRQAERARIDAGQHRLTRGLYLGAAAVTLLFFVIVLLLLRLLQRRLLVRLDQLGAAAARIGAGDFSARVPITHGDELTQVSAAFNRMAADREQATLELQAGEERYRSLFDRVPIGLYRSTPDGRFVDVNPACAELLGHPDRTPLLEQAVPLPPEQREAWKREIAARDGPHQVTWQLQRPDGSPLWIRDTAHAVRDENGNVLHYEGALEDVTDRVLAQTAVERSEARFRSLIENGSEGVVVLDENGDVRYQSPAVQRMLGYHLNDSVGDNVLSFVHRDDLSRVAGELAHLMTAGDVAEPVEFRCRHASGEWRVLRAVGSNLLQDPGVDGVVLNIQDVTEQRQLEQKLLQSQKMEAVGRLAGGIAHDFNNLLTAIGGYAEMLESSQAGPARAELGEIRHAVERATALTRQLLAFSRQQVVQPRAIDLSAVASGIQGMLVRLIGEDVELVPALEPGAWVLADPAQVEQVLLNLVVNARDAMPDGGAIAIGTRRVRLAEHDHGLPAGDYAELSVSDTGHGMPAEVLARAFDPFFTTKEVGKGTGLGLATVYGIATQAGGTVLAESAPGRGARFTVLLPLIAEPPVHQPAHAAPHPASGGVERVLLVEDEPSVRGLAERVLRRQGHDVVTAANGREALQLLDSGCPAFDIIITDVVMPEIGGPEMVAQIRRKHPDVPVLYISGYARESFGPSGTLAEPVNFLEKPFTPDELARRVRALLDQQTAAA